MQNNVTRPAQAKARHTTPEIDELERAVAAGSADQRAQIMRRVTDLFLSAPTKLSGEQVALFEDVIDRLIVRLESRAMAELSARLAPSPNAPPRIVRRLAADDSIEVAGPVLAGSSCLTDENLVEIAGSKGQGHLSKIAERRELSATVTDVLVDRGDNSVVKKVAGNAGARFSNMGMSALAMRADGNDELIETIARRVDIPSLIFRQLLGYATHQTRARLLAARPENSALVDQVLSQVSADAGRLAAMAKDWVAGQQLMQSFGQDTELTRTRVLEFADGGKITQLVAALSVLSEIEMNLVGRLICDQNGFGAMVLCKALNLEWSTAHAVLMAGPSADARAGQFEALCNDFDRLSFSTARRLLGYWHGRMKTRAAFEGALA